MKLPFRPAVQATDDDGNVIVAAGKYARNCVLVAFEMIGGVERMASWADENPGEFYTKLFSRTIGKETEHTVSQGVEDLLAKLDGQIIDGVAEEVVIGGEDESGDDGDDS